MSESGQLPFSPLMTGDPDLRRRFESHVADVLAGNADAQAAMAEMQAMLLEEGATEAIVGVLDADAVAARVCAAGFLLGCVAQSPGFLPDVAAERCRTVLVEQGLAAGPGPVPKLACTFLSRCELPPASLPVLRCLSADGDPELAAVACLALTRSPHDEPEILPRLRVLLDSGKEKPVTLAAVALVQLGVKTAEAVERVRARFRSLSPFARLAVLQAARDVGPAAAALGDEAARLLRDERTEASARKMAAEGLGRIDGAHPRWRPLLLENALRSKDWVVVHGGTEALVAGNGTPPEVVELLAGRLDDQDPAVRKIAAYGLAGTGDLALPLIAKLGRRLRVETDLDARRMIGVALLELGSPAVGEMIACLRDGTAEAVEVAGGSLVTLGTSAAWAVAEALGPAEQDHRLYRRLLKVLMSMGAGAAPAVPALSDLLDRTREPDLVLHVLQALFFCGAAAVGAVPAIVRCLAGSGSANVDIAGWAGQALSWHRRPAAEAIAAALPGAEGQSRVRLEAALAATGAAQPTVDPLAGLSKPHQIERFVLLADVLIEQGRPMSIRDVADFLATKPAAGQEKGQSNSSLLRALNAVSKHFGAQLTTHSRKGDGTLTAAGHAALAECKAHLAARDAARRRP